MKPGQIVLGRILFVKLRHHVSSRTEVMSVPATVQAAVWGRVYVMHRCRQLHEGPGVTQAFWLPARDTR